MPVLGSLQIALQPFAGGEGPETKKSGVSLETFLCFPVFLGPFAQSIGAINCATSKYLMITFSFVKYLF